MNIFIGGVNGTGKTTLLREVQAFQPSWQIIRSSSAFMEWLGIPGDYDRLRAFPPYERDKELSRFMDFLLTQERTAPLLVDSHYLNIKQGVVDFVTGPWLARFDAIVLLTAPSDVIWKRIISDLKFRDRALFSPSTTDEQNKQILDRYIEQTVDEFEALAKKFSLPHISIEHIDTELAAKQLISFVDSFSC